MAGRSGTGDGAGPAAGVHPVGDPGAGDAAAGARNLLAAAGAEPGDRVLIVGEAGPDPWFDPGLCEIVAGAARGAGMLPRVLLARPGAGAEEIPAEIPAAMDAADRTIFLSRLGDQVRFRPDLVRPGTVMSYTVDAGYLGSAFGRV